MRRLFLLIVVALFLVRPVAAVEQEPKAVAHGAEKAAHEVAQPAEAHGEGHAAPKTYFGIPGWILKIANLIVFVGVLAYFIAGPIGRAFRERSELIRKQIAEARERREKTDQLAGDIQARLQQIETEVAAILQRAGEEGERQKREMIVAAEAESAKILAAARNEVDARLKQARTELTQFAGELATDRARRLLAETITEDDRRSLFQESVTNLAEKQS